MALQADIPFFVLLSKRAVIVAGLLLFRVGAMSLFGGVGTIQFSSVRYDLITQEMLHLQYIGGFHADPKPHYGGWYDVTSFMLSV